MRYWDWPRVSCLLGKHFINSYILSPRCIILDVRKCRYLIPGTKPEEIEAKKKQNSLNQHYWLEKYCYVVLHSIRVLLRCHIYIYGGHLSPLLWQEVGWREGVLVVSPASVTNYSFIYICIKYTYIHIIYIELYTHKYEFYRSGCFACMCACTSCICSVPGGFLWLKKKSSIKSEIWTLLGVKISSFVIEFFLI